VTTPRTRYAKTDDGAEPAEVLVSRTVVDLVIGSGIQFSDRGEHHLEGVPNAWQIFAVDA